MPNTNRMNSCRRSVDSFMSQISSLEVKHLASSWETCSDLCWCSSLNQQVSHIRRWNQWIFAVMLKTDLKFLFLGPVCFHQAFKIPKLLCYKWSKIHINSCCHICYSVPSPSHLSAPPSSVLPRLHQSIPQPTVHPAHAHWVGLLFYCVWSLSVSSLLQPSEDQTTNPVKVPLHLYNMDHCVFLRSLILIGLYQALVLQSWDIVVCLRVSSSSAAPPECFPRMWQMPGKEKIKLLKL